MTIKYVTRWGGIYATEIIRETDKCVFLKCRDGSERKENKRREWQNYFDDFDSAKSFLVDQAEQKVKDIRARLEVANGDLGRIKGIKLEDVKELE
jgi:predicted DNA binding CopG/RHH family protein